MGTATLEKIDCYEEVLEQLDAPILAKRFILTAPEEVIHEGFNIAAGAMNGRSCLVKVTHVGLCHMDVAYHFGRKPAEKMAKRLPMIQLHEGAGRILSHPTLDVGTLVTFIAYHHCGECDMCVIGRTNYCRRGGLLGSAKPGLLQSHVILPKQFVVPVPDEISGFIAALTEPSAAAFRATQSMLDSRDSRIAVFGSGPIGYLLVANLAYFCQIPRDRLYFFGRSPEKLGLAEDFARIVPISEETINEHIEGFDLVFEAVGSPDAVLGSFQLTRKGGKCIILGTKDNPVTVEGVHIENVTNFVNGGGEMEINGKLLTSSSVSKPSDYYRLVEAMTDPKYRELLERMINPVRVFQIEGPEDVRKAFNYRDKNPHIQKVFLTFPSDMQQ